MQTFEERLLATVGGEERFEQSFAWRTFSPAKRAAQALADAAADARAGLEALAGIGVTTETAEVWLSRYIALWAKYQAAGARTANWMITGPARFPVERNRKRMEVEHTRGNELAAHVNGAAAWAQRQLRSADRAELIKEAATLNHEERVVNGVRLVKNVTLDRVQLVFPDKPSAENRALLKRHAFRWAPSAGAWQRQLTRNGLDAADAVLAKVAA
jgi:hypothetical protein